MVVVPDGYPGAAGHRARVPMKNFFGVVGEHQRNDNRGNNRRRNGAEGSERMGEGGDSKSAIEDLTYLEWSTALTEMFPELLALAAHLLSILERVGEKSVLPMGKAQILLPGSGVGLLRITTDKQDCGAARGRPEVGSSHHEAEGHHPIKQFPRRVGHPSPTLQNR